MSASQPARRQWWQCVAACSPSRTAAAAGASPPPRLTRRERSVLDLVGEGRLNKEIAAELGLNLRYVEKVVRKLLEKTETANRTALVRKALQTGLLPLDVPFATPSAVFVTQPAEARGGRLPAAEPRSPDDA